MALGVLSLAACSNVVGGVTDPLDDTTQTETPVPSVDKVDLVLVVDNSASMADKQQILSKSIHRLLDGLINPPCVNGGGEVQQPASPTAACPSGFERQFAPITSVHLGIISSSLGGLGAEQCEVDAEHDNNDRAHLLSRSSGGDVPTYLNYGFLNFDAALTTGGDPDFDSFVASAVQMVQGVGQIGCGYEMPLEAAYRFLADPNPYAEIQSSEPGSLYAVTSLVGVDTTLLEQRANFLRNDSLVGVVMLTDENDCSFKTGSQWYTLMNKSGFFKPTPICEGDPANTCCHSCALEGDPSCGVDPACEGTPKYNTQVGEDSVNLRCYHHMQRYGIDALYPTARYVNAFTRTTIAPDADDLVPDDTHVGVANPLFASGRDPRLFVFAGIVGVPWQLIAADPANPAAGSLSSDELVATNRWGAILGDPQNFVPAANPHMVESQAPRSGVSVDVNGGDRAFLESDLQYACTFPLATPFPNAPVCGAESANPLCDGSTQVGAGAYPSLRELDVMRALGDKAVVGSICEPSTTTPEEAANPNASTFGYNRTMNAAAGRMAALIIEGAQSK